MAVTAAVKDLERGGRDLFQDIFPAFAWTDCQNTCRLATQPRSEPDISQTRVLKLNCFNRDRGRDKGQRLEAATSCLKLTRNAECWIGTKEANDGPTIIGGFRYCGMTSAANAAEINEPPWCTRSIDLYQLVLVE
jgi:hypothetical protein